MNAEADLLKIYERWRRWTEAEGLAIGAEDWPRVAECQEIKRELQPIILHRTGQALSQTADPAELHYRVRGVVADLIALEHRNSEILSRQRERLTAERAALERSAHTLRRLHHSYVPAAPARWQSFS